jgi:hypothetical protein
MFKVLKGNCQPQKLHPKKLSFSYEAFPTQAKTEVFIATGLALQGSMWQCFNWTKRTAIILKPESANALEEVNF